MRKFPQKCQKIAGCWESAVYGSRPPVASKPDSSPPERPDLDNTTSQPWSEATCPCTTSASAYLRFVTIFLLEKTRQSTRSGGTWASCLRPWLTRDIVECLCCHIYCAQLCAHLCAIVIASCAVSNRQSRYPHRDFARLLGGSCADKK